jgi:hypothetical protein
MTVHPLGAHSRRINEEGSNEHQDGRSARQRESIAAARAELEQKADAAMKRLQ